MQPFRQLPPEIEAARQTLAAARRDALPTVAARRGRLALYLSMFAVGAIVGAVLIRYAVVSPDDKDFWRAALTAISVLTGFMITTMVFTGKIEAAKSLSLDELRSASAKVNHLLLFQFGTLANHLVCLSFALLTPAIAARWVELGDPVGTLCLALLLVSVARSLLVPLQILELHRFTHAALLREKREEAAARTKTI